MTVKFSFKVRLNVGGEIVPLASEVVAGAADTQGGVENGFLFKLDRQPGDPPVVVNLGAILSFIEQQMGASDLSGNPQVAGLQKVFPDAINDQQPFTKDNSTLIAIESFLLNSTAKETLFSISVDILGSDPAQGLISFPAEFNQWLKIDNLAIAFTADKKAQPAPADGG